MEFYIIFEGNRTFPITNFVQMEMRKNIRNEFEYLVGVFIRRKEIRTRKNSRVNNESKLNQIRKCR